MDNLIENLHNLPINTSKLYISTTLHSDGCKIFIPLADSSNLARSKGHLIATQILQRDLENEKIN